MIPRRFPFWQFFFGCSFFTLILPLGVLAWRSVTESLPENELKMLRLVHHQVLQDYVEARDSHELLNQAIQGLVGSLDQHSAFIPPADVQRFENEEIDGAYQGIGVLLARNQSPITVQWPLPGGPAARAGIEVGDRILGVDGADISDLPREEATGMAAERIRGPAGTPVVLRIDRNGREPFDVELKRGTVPEAKVKWAQLLGPDHDIGYLHVTAFQRNMVTEFDAAVQSLQQTAGGRLRGLIVDLRHNPGGLLTEAVELANRFLSEGEIVSMKRRDAEVIESHSADPKNCTLPDLPVVLLMNQGSASASEVVAGALQDHGRARLVGSRSYGKGVVQSIYEWKDLDFRLKMTTSHYYTPNGRSIERKMRRQGDGDAPGGLEPDRTVPVDEPTHQEIGRALAAREPPAEYLEQVRALCAELGLTIAEPPDPAEDPQLAAAVEEVLKLDTVAQPATGNGR